MTATGAFLALGGTALSAAPAAYADIDAWIVDLFDPTAGSLGFELPGATDAAAFNLTSLLGGGDDLAGAAPC